MDSTKALQENLLLYKTENKTSWAAISRMSKGGISPKHVQRIVTDKNQSPTLKALDSLSKALGVKSTDLITPGWQSNIIRDEVLEGLIADYNEASKESKIFIASIAEREKNK